MKVNTLERRVLAWILVFALFLSNIPFGVLAEEIQPDASQNQEAPVLETQPEATEQTEPADDETQPSVPETEPEAPTVETTVQCTCGAEGDVHSADCVLYVPTFYEKLLAAQTLKELRDLLTGDPESAAALTAAELTSLKVYAEQLFAAASTEENQGCYDEIMSVLSQLLGQTTSEEPEASAPADVVEGTVPVVENDRYDESQDSYADATALENFEYTLDETTATVLLTKYIGTATAVIVAPQYTLENVVYTTVLDSATVFRGNTKITSVKLYEGVQFSNYTMSYLFYGCTKLVSVDMHGVNTTGVTDMSYMFYKCSKMTTLDMTGIDTSQVTTMYALLYECSALQSFAGYQNWNTSSLQNIFWMFNKVQGMQVVDLSKWDMSQINNSAWCFQYCYAQQILLPDNLKTMSAGFLNHAHSITGSTFTIPAGVQKIGYAHTIYDFATDDFVEFIVAEGNTNYVAIDGILYSADGKEMLAIPRNKTFENNTYAVPEGVEFFGELSFSRNYNIHTLLLPNSYEIVQNIPKHDPRYIIFEDIGNLNAGNSLTIAIYVYTGVTDYAVKDDNPRYESIDGIIYSEDMTTVLAIPTKYNRYMDIPEGVTTFAVEAMWAESETDSFLSECTGISIPSTLTDIAPDQLAKLNRLNKRADFTVEVHPDNPVYALNEEGTIETVGTVVARNENTRAAYTTLADALAAAADDETITLLTDITLGENLTVSADVTINGDGHTITRDDAYTGTMLTISEGATLTLDGGVVIDGGNEWVFHRDEFLAAIEEFRNDYSKVYSITAFRTFEEGAPQATNDMIKASGSLVLNNATVQNHVGTGGNISAIYVAGTGALTINEGASIRHNYTYGGAGTLHTAAGSTVVMNGGEIAENYGGNWNGPNIEIFGTFIMNGGKIHHNYGIKTNGIVLFLHDGGTFILRDGEICENAALKGDSGWHCAIYIHNNATMEMHGGKVWHNSNRISAIHLYGSSSKFIFTGGLLIENDIQQSSYSAYSDINPTYGPAVVSGGTCTNDVGAYVVDGFGLAIDRKTVNGKDYVYYTTSDQLIQLKSNGKIYPTFDAAMEDAVDGDTLTVLRDQRVIVDATKSESTVLDKDVTIDFNGKTVYGWGTQNPVFRILADVTITGNGTMDAMTFGTGNAFGIGDSETAGTLTIKDGNHYANTTIASVTNGTLNVEGGYFEATPYVDENGVDYGHRYTLCSDEVAYGNGSAEIHVSGGTYYGFDPQNNLAQGEGTDFVTDNHWSLNNSAQSTWTVHPYITVTFQDARMLVGDSVPAVQYTVDYGTVGQDKVKVVVEPAVIENPALGEYEITGTVKLIDGTDKAENYRMAVIPGTLRVMDIVARIVETGERYGTLADAIADANALETATVELLKDVEFNQLLTVTGNVTVLGNGHTVIRGKQADDAWYTDTLFDVSEGASLTLDGNLTIDGNHAWTYRETDGVIDLKNAVDNYQDFTGYDGLRFVSVKADKPVATADMFTVKGSLTLNAVTIQNHYATISTSGTAGGSSVIEMGSTGTLTMNEGAVLTHNAMPSYGTLVYMVNGSRFDMNGGVMSQNASAHHGVCIHMEGGVTTVNGGKVMHNHTCGGQGIFVRINNGELIVNGGEVYENAAFPSTGNSRNKVGAVIDATSKGKVTINDVHIHDNFGYFAGGINHVSLKGDGAFTITGGKFVNNTAWGAFDEDSRLSDVSFGRPGTTVTGGIYSTEIYQACVLTANKDSIIPSGHEQFVIGTDAEGNPNLWEVAPGWIITFQDEEGNVLQSGPVRAGEIPVFNTPPLEDGYGIFWDKPLAPATEDATYTMTIKLVVAEVVNGDTHKGYFATLQDAVDAAASGDTVRLLVDNLPVTSVVTVSDKEITLDGNSKTLVREDSYTGAFFNVPAGGSLTIGGDLIIDGGNEWTYNETDGVPDLKTVVDNYTTRVPYTNHSFITYEPGAPIATVPMMTVGGCVVLDDVTIQNNVGTRIVQMASGGKLTTNSDTVFTHNAGTLGAVINVVSGSEVIMDGGTITQTVSHEHGGCIRIEAGTVTMNDGLIHHNYTTGQGSAVRLNGGAFVLNGGDICENVAMPFNSSGNNAGAAIDNTDTGVVTINGGSIHNNFGYMVGGINHIGSSLTITGGSFVDNTAWGVVTGREGLFNTDHYPDIFYAASSAKPVIITGGIFGTEIYGACTATAEQDQLVTPVGFEEFVIGIDAEGNPNLWEVAPGWIITFQDDEGNVLQSGPVREGTIPVFSSAVPPHEEGYGIFWDKPLAPATEDATYTLVWKLIVAEVVNGDTHKGYFATLQDAVDAAVTDDTVRILVDIPMTAKVTVTGKKITLDGNNLTVTRGKLENGSWYTGNLITVSKDASLTLDGNLTVDGANEWIFDQAGYSQAFETFSTTNLYSGTAFLSSAPGAPIAKEDMIVVAGEGSLTVNKATLCNHYGGAAQCSAIDVSAKGKLTLNDDALNTHVTNMGQGPVMTMNAGSLFTMNGGKINKNHTILNGMIYNNGGTIVMNAGIISDNTGINCNGSAMILTGSAKFIMKYGEICRNSSLPGPNNAFNSAIYLHSGNSSMEMHDGYVYRNIGSTGGGIWAKYSTAKLVIDGGWVVENVNMLAHQTENEDLVKKYTGIHDVGQKERYMNAHISGVSHFTQDVNQWCTTEYIAVPQDPKSMGISEDFTLWIVDKTTMDSRSEETEIFGTVTDTDTAVSRDSAYTVVFDVDHFYNRCYQSPMLHFSQDLPENTTLILQNMGRGESGYWGYTVQDQTNDIPLSAFIRMGTADEAYETPMVKPEFQVVVDFSDTTGGMPVDTLETSLYLVPADMLPTDDPDYYVSGAVRWITEEDAEGLTETVSITSVEDIALADYDCTLTSVSSDGLENTLSYTLQLREPASKWDYRELALLVTIPDLPNDAHLFLNGSTQPIHPYEDGTFIVPLGSDFDGQVTLTLASDVFPTEGGTYQATCRLYAAATIADAAPLNGQYLDRQVTCTFTSQADFASVDVIEVNDKRLFTAEDRITVKVANILSSQYGIEVKLEMKGSDGIFVAMNRNYEQNGNTVTYSLNDCDPGSYRIRAIVKDETGGNVVTQESYYFIVD